MSPILVKVRASNSVFNTPVVGPGVGCGSGGGGGGGGGGRGPWSRKVLLAGGGSATRSVPEKRTGLILRLD